MTKTLIEYENGGRIEVYPQVDASANDYGNILACCDCFAKQGAKTVITPHFSETVGNPIYHIIYASLEGTKFWGRCPDFNVGGLWYEHEGYDVNKDLTDRKKRADTFSEMITRGVRQSDRIIVEDCGVGRRWAKKTVYSRVHFEKQNIKEVYIRTSDGLECLYKKEAG